MKHYIPWRLLQCLQQGVEGLGGDHVNLVDYVDLVLALHRGIGHVFAQLTDIVDAVVGGAVDLYKRQGGSLFYLKAVFTTPQGVAVGPSWQFRALARIRAMVVLPTPRGPEKR
jgi:hypothetical protein